MAELSHNDLKRGVRFVFNGEPYEVVESEFIFKGRGQSSVRVKIKNLITGKVINQTFHPSDKLEEIEIEREKLKFLYSKGEDFYFALIDEPSKRFVLKRNIIGIKGKFLKQNDEVDGLFWDEKLINIEMPLKVQLKVVSAPPGIKGGRETPGTKSAILETGAEIQVPLFIESGDIIEVNTETGEYIRRV